MAQPTILVQAVDDNNDPLEGPNGPIFLEDIDAVAQIIATTLKLLRGEWWESLDTGFPLFQNIIGGSGSQSAQTATQVITQNAILSCPYVLQILSFTYVANSATRAESFSAIVSTTFGNITVTNTPGLNAALVTS